jgi:hypothetical protein
MGQTGDIPIDDLPEPQISRAFQDCSRREQLKLQTRALPKRKLYSLAHSHRPTRVYILMKIHRFTFLAALLTSRAFAQTNTFPASGNVGIGTTNPTTTLEVAGYLSADYLHLKPQNGVGEGGELQLAGSGGYGTFQIDNFAGHLRIHTLAPGSW